MELYHYRPIDTALKEILNGTFRYSDRSELNDPIEGYVQVYWQGDKPAWEGLFRNYICSLFQSIEFYLVAAKYEEIEKNAVLLGINCFDNVPLGVLLKGIANKFMDNQYVQKIIVYLSTQNIRCSVKVMRILLRIVHEIAFSICMECMKEKNLIPEYQEESYIPVEEIVDKIPIDIMKKLGDADRKLLLEVSDLIEDMIESRFLTLRRGEQWQTWLKLRIDFPTIYTNQIQEIIYPKGYVVCFSSCNNNSAMWGNYANNHKGVCLIYQTKTADEKETISVKSQVSLSGRGISYSFRNDQVRPVKYNSPLIQRNFFESLGRLNYFQLASWLVTGTGEKSEILAKYNDEEWRNKYWADYTEKYCLKLPSWKHEQEYRLLLIDGLHEHTPEERFVEYALDNLVGIIFGIETSQYDKMQIINAIKDTGRNLDNFKFYQAEYDDEEQGIKIREKKLFLQ